MAAFWLAVVFVPFQYPKKTFCDTRSELEHDAESPKEKSVERMKNHGMRETFIVDAIYI